MAMAQMRRATRPITLYSASSPLLKKKEKLGAKASTSMPRARIATATGLALLVLATAIGTDVTPSAAATSSYASSARVPIGQTTELGDGSGMVTINDASTTIVGKATPYPSIAPIDGLVGRVSKVVLRIKGYAHQWPTDVDMMLERDGSVRRYLHKSGEPY